VLGEDIINLKKQTISQHLKKNNKKKGDKQPTLRKNQNSQKKTNQFEWKLKPK